MPGMYKKPMPKTAAAKKKMMYGGKAMPKKKMMAYGGKTKKKK